MYEHIERCTERPRGQAPPHESTLDNPFDVEGSQECEDCELLSVGDPSTDESDGYHPGGSESDGSESGSSRFGGSQSGGS